MPEVADRLPLEKYQMTKTQCLAKTYFPPPALEKMLSEPDFPVPNIIFKVNNRV